LKADLYVQSEKLAKQARFVMDKAQAPTAVVEMLLADQLSNHKETRIRYLQRQPKPYRNNGSIPCSWQKSDAGVSSMRHIHQTLICLIPLLLVAFNSAAHAADTAALAVIG